MKIKFFLVLVSSMAINSILGSDHLSSLPNEIKLKILTSEKDLKQKDLKQFFTNISRLSEVNKSFNKLLTDSNNIALLVDIISETREKGRVYTILELDNKAINKAILKLDGGLWCKRKKIEETNILPLWKSFSCKNINMASLFIELGMNINDVDNESQTLLTIAIDEKDFGMAEFFLDKGADFAIFKKGGFGPQALLENLDGDEKNKEKAKKLLEIIEAKKLSFETLQKTDQYKKLLESFHNETFPFQNNRKFDCNNSWFFYFVNKIKTSEIEKLKDDFNRIYSDLNNKK